MTAVLTVRQSFGGHSGGETPGPIPNPEAKPACADGTARGTGWESRTPPNTPSVTATPTRVAVTHFAHPHPPLEPFCRNGSAPWCDVRVGTGGLHHLEIWVADLAVARRCWDWLLGELGWVVDSEWPAGVSYRLGEVYVVVEAGPDVTGGTHERRRPGLNHLAVHAGTPADVDRMVAAAGDHGWTLLFADRHPYAGGPQHHAAYLESDDGFEVELVAAREQGRLG